MQCTTLLLTLASIAIGQNHFSINPIPQSISVDTPFNITWSPLTGTVDTVTLVLRRGDPNAISTVLAIPSGIRNTGSCLWTPSSSIINGPLYAFQIIVDGDTGLANYFGKVAIDPPNSVPPSPPFASSASSSSAASSTTSTPAITPTATATRSSSVRTTSTSKATTATASPSVNESKTPNINQAGMGMGEVGGWISGCLLTVVWGVMFAM